jgi:alkanesulfonate monooxygenase SsuD/methylene tetrahydromethanopterin reductase-like flavin-dependent oxidoreductase (luciferase family)
MKIGLFDHLEQSLDRPLAQQFDERLDFAQACDEAGFYCLHIAEHHSSPLNSVPAPGVWLSAVARATKTLRIGPLVYLLPLYSPLRLAEEICILDHLSKGRLEVGVGRGVSPYEVGFHNIDHDKSRDIFMDAYACLVEALTHDEFSYKGPHYEYNNVPMPLRPLQQPFPAIWYGSSNTIGSTWAGEQGFHFASNGPVERAAENIAAFRAGLEKRGAPAHPKPEFPGGTAIGMLRHVVVAETDAEAERIARPAIEHHANSLNWLRSRHGDTEYTKRLNIHRHTGFEDWQKMGMVVAGSPDTVIREITRQAGVAGINYLISYMFFGTMTLADAKGSLALFRDEVMPALEAV